MLTQRVALAVAVLVLLAPLPSDAQPPKAVTVGVLAPSAGRNPIDIAFEQALRERGWVPGRNIRIETRYAAGKPEAFAPLTQELIGLGADVLVAWTGAAAVIAQRTAGPVPIVFLAVGDPLTLGLVSTLARPGRNITGVAFDVSPEIYAKRLELLKETVPGVARVALVVSSGTRWSPEMRSSMVKAGQALKVDVREIEVRSPEDLEAAVRGAREQGAQALYVLSPNPFAWGTQLATLAITHRLPSAHHFRESAVAGGLLSYAASLTHIAGQGAAYVDKIARGTKPADLPVEQPSKFELVVNLKTAKALGLTIPPSVLLRADTIIE